MAGKAAPETPWPKFDEARSLGTNLGIMQMSKVSHAAKYCLRPIRFTEDQKTGTGKPVP